MIGIPGVKDQIAGLKSAEERLNALFALASIAYDDYCLGRDFTLEQHRGHTGMALGAPDMNTFVDVTDLAETPEGTTRAVLFLQKQIITNRIHSIYKASAQDVSAFFERKIPSLGMSPIYALNEEGRGFEFVMAHLDHMEMGGYA